MDSISPDIGWYTSLSLQRQVPPRCPFATAHRCPRYYASLSLIGRHGGATEIDPTLDEALQKRWRDSDLMPATAEQEPSVFGSDDSVSFFNFCPETLYDRFGWFATGLYPYSDEIDRDSAHARLEHAGTNSEL